MSAVKRTLTSTNIGLLGLVLITICAGTLLYFMLPAPLETSFGDGVYLYVFGSSSCPYCRSLEDFFSKEYAGRYYFCAVDKDSSCRYRINDVEKLLVGKGVSTFYLQFVPQTYVVVDGKYLTAVVVGGITEPQFWENITRREPGESVLFVVPPATFEIPMTHEEQAKLINTLASQIWDRSILQYLIYAVIASYVCLLGYVFVIRKHTHRS